MRTLPAGGVLPGKQPIALGRGAVPVPGTGMKRPIGTASQGGARPMTAVSGAGFNSRQMSVPGIESSVTVTLEPKIET